MKGKDNYGRRILVDGYQPVRKNPPLPRRVKSCIVSPTKVVKLVIVEDKNMKFYHGSSEHLKDGFILKAMDEFTSRPEGYEVILESLRPKHAISRHHAVYMASNMDDLDSLGAIMDYVYEVEPLSVVEKHDLTWATEIQVALEEGETSLADEYAKNYWKGVSTNFPLWEFLTSKAKILSLIEENL